MREFKFRGWTGDKFILHDLLSEIGGNPDCNCFSGDLIFQQFTGLKDKQGKEIYERDILHFDASEWGSEKGSNFVIEWNDKLAGFEGNGAPSDWHEWCEVVGNIYENPELVA